MKKNIDILQERLEKALGWVLTASTQARRIDARTIESAANKAEDHVRAAITLVERIKEGNE